MQGADGGEEAETKNQVAQKDVLTVPELAEILRCSRRTAYGLVEEGEVPSFRVGRKLVRIRRGDVDSYIRRQLIREGA